MAVTTVDNASLRVLNTFGIDARARRLVTVDTADDLPEALAACGPDGPALVLGGGSNLLFAGDVDGAVLRLATRGIVFEGDGASGPVTVTAQAGEPWDGFVQATLARGLQGLENLSLIPGTVGASPIQNIGAYGVEMRDRCHHLHALHLDTHQVRRFEPADCRFGYRDSVFKQADNRWMVTSVAFALDRAGGPLTLGYGEVAAELARAMRIGPSAADVAKAVIAIRRRKLPDPALIGNAGSFFKNPIVSAAQARALREAHPDLPVYPAGDEGRGLPESAEPPLKLPAGWLIERCGWKGHRDGDAGVHDAHALVLVNHGSATGAQLLALARRIQTSVSERFGVTLVAEPKIVGGADPI